MTLETAVEIVVSRTGFTRLRWLTSNENTRSGPSGREAYCTWAMAEASKHHRCGHCPIPPGQYCGAMFADPPLCDQVAAGSHDLARLDLAFQQAGTGPAKGGCCGGGK